MRVYVNRERAVWDMETIFVWGESSVTCNRRICLCLRKKYLDLSNDYKFTYVKRVFWRALKLSFNFFSPENSIIASGEVNTILHLSPSACSMARRNTFIAHWIFPSKVNRKKKFQTTKSSVSHAKRKYSSTLDNFSLSSQQLVLSYILYPCKCPDVYVRGILAQLRSNKHFSQTAMFCPYS